MKRKLFDLSRRYQDALRAHLKQGQHASLDSARGLGGNALAAGMQTLDQNLSDLVKRNIISPAEARSKAKIPENFPG